MQQSTLSIAALACVLGALAPASASAQVAEELTDPAGPPDDASEEAPVATRRADPALIARMQDQLERRAQSEITSGVVTGVTSLSLGVLLLGSSIWLSVDEDAFGLGFGTPSLPAITGFAASPMLLATGLYTLLAVRSNGDRLERWRAAMAGELTALELGRFEGELRAEANAARVSRWGGFALGVGLMVGGATTLILSAALDGFDDETRGIVAGTGGLFLALGGVVTGTSFIESSVEQMWSDYQRGAPSPQAGASVQLVVGLGSVGLVGTF